MKLGIVVTLVSMAAAPAGQDRSGAVDPIGQLVLREMAARRIPGISIAVIDRGRTVKKDSYGLASVELSVPVSNSTLFHLASATKEFTGVAIMALAEEGRLRLDESIRTYLPGVPSNWAPVTIRHCLSHTSGLPDGVASDSVNIIPLAGDRESLLKMLAPIPPKEPGKRAVYNQTELMLLADIIERVSGKPYQAFIEDRLLRPIGISDMTWGDSWAVIPGRASLYTALEPAPDRSRLWLDANGRPVFSSTGIHAFGAKGEPEWMMPAAGLNANIDSMVKWESALWSGKIISPSSLALMGRPFPLSDGGTGPFGLVLMAGQQDGRATESSGGGAAVWITTMPDDGVTVVVLTNLQASSPQSLAAKILALYLQGRERRAP